MTANRRACPHLVLLEIRLDLGLASGAKGRLVDREQNHLVVVGQHGAVEATVHGTHILGSELREIVETLFAR